MSGYKWTHLYMYSYTYLDCSTCYEENKIKKSNGGDRWPIFDRVAKERLWEGDI